MFILTLLALVFGGIVEIGNWSTSLLDYLVDNLSTEIISNISRLPGAESFRMGLVVACGFIINKSPHTSLTILVHGGLLQPADASLGS